MKFRSHQHKGLTPVIAIIIIVATSITIAVAVSYYLKGVSTQYAKVEKIEIQYGYCTWNSTGGYWKIELLLKNTGTTTVSFQEAFVNNVRIQNYGVDAPVAGETSINMNSTTTITSGDSMNANIYISQGYATLSVGTTVNVKILSATGLAVVYMIQLI